MPAKNHFFCFISFFSSVTLKLNGIKIKFRSKETDFRRVKSLKLFRYYYKIGVVVKYFAKILENS